MKKRDYAGGSQKMAGNEQIASEVGKNPNGIGYVGLAYMKAGGIKVVPIDGADAFRPDSAGQELGHMRVLPSITRTAIRTASRSSSSTSRSAPRGQKVVANVGFVPVK